MKELVLGIESSCDETAASVVEGGRRILSNIVASQVPLHRRYGGVVPEIASRRHVELILPVIDTALQEAGVQPEQLDANAVTRGPGLIGSLLVGLSRPRLWPLSPESRWWVSIILRLIFTPISLLIPICIRL